MSDAAAPRLDLEDDPPADALAIVDAGLDEANRAAAPLHQVQRLACVGRDEAGRVIGGAVGRTWGACAELQQLWVAPAQRRHGLGARLVRHFESRAAARGCRLVYLQTFSFQAPAFYARLGYVTVQRVDGYAPGIWQQWMQRALPA